MLRANFVRLASANLGAQLVPFFALPLITRLFSPEDYGLFTVFLAASTVLATCVTLRLDWRISSTAPEPARVSETVGALAAMFLLLAITFPIVLIVFEATSWRRLLPSVPGTVALLLLSAALQASLLHASAWHIAAGNLAPNAAARWWSSVTANATMIGAGFVSSHPLGLIFGFMLGTLMALHLAGKEPFCVLRSVDCGKAIGRWWLRIDRDRSSVGFSAAASIVNTVGLYLPPLVIAPGFGVESVGIFAMVQRLGGAPLSAIGAAVSQSFWSEATRLMPQRPDDLSELHLSLTRRLALFMIAVVSAYAAAPLILPRVLGGDWSDAATVLCALIPSILLQGVVSPLSPVLTTLGAVRWVLVWDVLRAVVLAAVFVGGAAASFHFFEVVWIYSAVMAVFYLVFYAKIRVEFAKAVHRSV